MLKLKRNLATLLVLVLLSVATVVSCGKKAEPDGAEQAAEEHPADSAEHPSDSTEHPADSTQTN